MCRGHPRAGGAARVEAPAPSGVESGEGCPLPSRLEMERFELPQWVPGGSPAANAFSAYSRPQNASRRKKNAIVM